VLFRKGSFHANTGAFLPAHAPWQLIGDVAMIEASLGQDRMPEVSLARLADSGRPYAV
jgi:hypothetical protein